MKKLTLSLMALAMVLTLAQCKKNEPEGDRIVPITLNVQAKSDGSKINVDPQRRNGGVRAERRGLCGQRRQVCGQADLPRYQVCGQPHQPRYERAALFLLPRQPIHL